MVSNTQPFQADGDNLLLAIKLLDSSNIILKLQVIQIHFQYTVIS